MVQDIAISQVVLKEDNVELKSFESSSSRFLHFSFKNKFTLDCSEKATRAWSEFCQSKPGEKFVHIWDSQNMSGFDKSAKDLWMKNLDKFSNQTEKVILVADNIIIRGAARIMSKFIKIQLNVYKNMQEMSANELIENR